MDGGREWTTKHTILWSVVVSVGGILVITLFSLSKGKQVDDEVVLLGTASHC
jgi:predicted Co/Zn/Cd cation transporter (cation efflux family)